MKKVKEDRESVRF